MSGHPDSDRLQDYLDDLLCREERAELEAHLATCEQCTAEVVGERELRRVLAELPRSIAPERDLLAGINAAIDAAAFAGGERERGALVANEASHELAGSPGAGGAGWQAPADRTVVSELRPARARFADRPVGSLRYVLAVAALVLVAITAAITLQLARPGGRAQLAGADPASQPPTAVAAEGARDPVVREVLATEASYLAASAELEAALAAGRSQLDPATVRLVEANLRVVEAALAEARAALRREPDNAALAQLLRHAHEQKLALLRRATRADT